MLASVVIFVKPGSSFNWIVFDTWTFSRIIVIIIIIMFFTYDCFVMWVSFFYRNKIFIFLLFCLSKNGLFITIDQFNRINRYEQRKRRNSKFNLIRLKIFSIVLSIFFRFIISTEGKAVCKGSKLFKIDRKGDLNGPQACIATHCHRWRDLALKWIEPCKLARIFDN